MISEFSIRTGKKTELIDMTDKIQPLVRDIDEGIVTVYVPHTTAGITINENADPDVKKDILKKLSELVPEKSRYLHAEGNSDAHIKATLVGNSVTVIVREGRLMLGTWQSIFFAEFDGSRTRRVIVKY
jgi:secondary thiamine-phosphate synthase enzyme